MEPPQLRVDLPVLRQPLGIFYLLLIFDCVPRKQCYMQNFFQLLVLSDDQDVLFWGIYCEVVVVAFVQLSKMFIHFLLDEFVLFLPPLETAYIRCFCLSETDKASNNRKDKDHQRGCVHR